MDPNLGKYLPPSTIKFLTVGSRVRLVREMLGGGPGRAMSRESIQATGGKRLSASTLKRAERKGELSADTAYALAGYAKDRGVIVDPHWLVTGEGKVPTRGYSVPIEPQGARAANAEVAIGDARLFDMKSAAEKVCQALREDLDRSRALVLLNTDKERARQQQLVWALKDLARQLHRLGFDMRDLFDVTDDLAREIGLPLREDEKKP